MESKEPTNDPAYAKASAGEAAEAQAKVGERDLQTWEIAKRRVSFKNHLATYLVINAFLWCIWLFYAEDKGGYWPIWTTGGWGIGVVFHFLGAYVFPRENSVEREYEKMMRNKR